ncbi:MAG: hypothetical protein M0D53_10495 [Flavobacterium sp. JAD_PAG50586_2]|nr:MAG: hypothetical protein M0D53_10495 [Flavobacterium sp. JAD_PAG50586_2]
MKKTAILITVSVVALVIQSCGYGHSVVQNFTLLDATAKTINCETPPQNIELVFDGEKVNFEYDKVGLIEVQGESFSNDKEVLEKIKALAKTNCCDAIINLKRDRTNRESGLLFTTEYDHSYSAITFHGIAVRKKISTPANESQNQQQ